MQEEVAGNSGATVLLARIQSLIGQELEQVERVFEAELDSPLPFVHEVLTHLAGYRGKRLRPMLLLLSAQACGGILPQHRVLAAVIEMIHTATLVHDDVLDDATTRRHVTTINARWSNETSVLLGDYLFTHAFHLTSSLGDAEACRWIGRATNVVCAGELQQIAERGNLDLSEEQYFDIIESKTAELCAISCALGARFTDVPPATSEALDRFGRSLGVAFQIADDLLDVVGTEAVAGKSLGSDLQKQKLTLPLIYLMGQATAAEREDIRGLLRTPDAGTRAALAPFLARHGAIEYARSRAMAYSVAACQSLSCLPDTPAKRFLEALAEFVPDRTA